MLLPTGNAASGNLQITEYGLLHAVADWLLVKNRYYYDLPD